MELYLGLTIIFGIVAFILFTTFFFVDYSAYKRNRNSKTARNAKLESIGALASLFLPVLFPILLIGGLIYGTVKGKRALVEVWSEGKSL